MNIQSTSVSLNDCDREPIHTPGSIQPHGAMLICNQETGLISHASANAESFFDVGFLVGLTLEAALGDQVMHDLRNAASIAGGAQIAGMLVNVAIAGRAGLVDMCMHRHENRIFVELQPATLSGQSAQDTLDITHSFVLRLHRQTTVDTIAATGARLVRAMLGYDRVMVYRLLHNGAGRVIAEAKAASLPSFLGQHFPASDIPRQARRLYLLNSIRAIADVQYAPSQILPPQRAGETPIDMSYAQLRSVSPIHCEYLRNMGVAASMSISIIVDGELWGLIACHHDTPKVVAMPLRVGAELFGHYFSLQIALAERRSQAVAAASARAELDKILAELVPDKPVADILLASLPRLAAMIPCDGSGLWIDGRWNAIGAVPSHSEVEDVVALVKNVADGRVWESHDLQSHLGRAKTYGMAVAGVLAIPISSAPRDYLLLFRSEEAHNIEWAGEPAKTKTADGFGERLTPRGSFAVWREEVRGRARPWSPSERTIAGTIRDYLRDVVLRSMELTFDEQGRAEQRRRLLNDELNHRVKNIIALVKSIAVQTGTHATSVQAYAAAFEGRLRALAHAHDHSLEAHAGTLAALVEPEASLHRYGSNPDRIVAEGPAVGLDDRAYGVLALVIHEMMTNAAKYGALSVREGRLKLSWSLTPEGDCALEWQENGGPPVMPPLQEGFGGKLIRSSIVYDLRGSVVIEHRSAGLYARFTIPGTHLIAPSISAGSNPVPPIYSAFFAGKDVLVVEDQSLIAIDMDDTLRQLGAREVRCAPAIQQALQALRNTVPDCAILDFNLGDHTSAIVADELLGMGIPFVFATGYGDSIMIPARFKNIPVLRKPISADMLLAAFSRHTTTLREPEVAR